MNEKTVFQLRFPANGALSLGLLLALAGGFCRAQDVLEESVPAEAQRVPMDVLLGSPEVAPLLERINSYQANSGEPPDMVFYYELIESFPGLSGMQQGAVQAEVNRRQSPIVSLDDLIELLEAKRDSITRFDCRYRVQGSEFPKRRFAFSGTSVYYQKADEAAGSTFQTYDGEAFRTLVYRDSSDKDPFGTITSDGVLSSLFEAGMPLCRMMLADSRLTGRSLMLFDLAEYLRQNIAVVYQKTHQIEGLDCILVSNGGADVYLAVDKNFAVVRLDNFVNEFEGQPDESAWMAIRRRTQTHRTTLTDFKDYGNGLELPLKIQFEVYDTNSGPPAVTYAETTSVDEININPVFPDKFFSDIFPNNAVVQDDILGLVYVQGQKSSLGQMVQTRVTAKRSRTLFVINLVVLAVIAGVVIFRRVRNAPRMREE